MTSALRRCGPLLLAAAFWLAGGPDSAAAQGPPPGAGGGGRVDVTLSSASVVFPTPGIADFDTGWIDHPGVLASVTTQPPNSAWELRLRADDVDLGGYGKPLGDLLYRVQGSTVWIPLTGSDQAVVQGTGASDVTVYFRMRLAWTMDEPNTYATQLTFTAVRL
jgi:hypothetical protein